MEIKTSTGVIFKVKKVPSRAFQDVVKKWRGKEPQVPVVYIESKGKEEPNPADPDYIEQKKRYEQDMSLALIDAAILLCTEIVSIPEGVEKPEDSGWLENLEILGIAPSEGKRERYLAWVKYYAAPHDEDMLQINTAIFRQNGVSEGDVTAAMAEFKSTQARGTDRDVSSERAN